MTTKINSDQENIKENLLSFQKEEGSDLLSAMLDIFKDRLPWDILELQKGLDKKNTNLIAEKSHLMIGSFSSLGLTQGAKLSLKVEYLSKEENFEELTPVGLCLIEYMNKVL